MDIIDVLRLARTDPSLLADEKRLGQLGLSTADLAVVRKLDPEVVRRLAEQLELKIRGSELASSQACTGGTQACVGRPMDLASVRPGG